MSDAIAAVEDVLAAYSRLREIAARKSSPATDRLVAEIDADALRHSQVLSILRDLNA